MKAFRPGDICEVSGQYAIVWLATGTRTGRERTVVRGEPFPPTPEAGQGFVLVDATRT